MNELVSIVIPVYNVRDYVEQCLKSVLAQTYQNIEVIAVLDGPTDGSDEICRRYAERDGRIKVVSHGKNKGLLCARISGVQAASGEYLGFVDGDDYIDPDLYQRLMECRGGFDLVISRWERDEGDKTRVRGDPLAPGPYTTEADMAFILEHVIGIVEPGGGGYIKPGIAAFVWNKLLKTALARKIYEKFDTNIMQGEDRIFMYQYILACTSVLITDICGYHYRIRKASGSHSVFNLNSYMADIQRVYGILEPIFMAHPRRDILMPQLQQKMASVLSHAPDKMGFCSEAQNRAVVFPFLNMLDGKRIALYGAGAIGQAYMRQIRRYNMCDVALWVDERWEYRRREGWDVSPVETLRAESYEYVVIAAEQRDEAEKIREDLLSIGAPEDRILWKAPVEIS